MHLKTIATFRLLAHDVKHIVDEFRTFRVVTLGPIVTRTTLSEHKVVGTEELAVCTVADRVHSAGLEINKDGAGNVLSAMSFIVINVNAFELEITFAFVGTIGLNAVLVGDHLPELGADLVSALTGLDVYDFAHFRRFGRTHKELELHFFASRPAGWSVRFARLLVVVDLIVVGFVTWPRRRLSTIPLLLVNRKRPSPLSCKRAEGRPIGTDPN
jgi:hypothetical protein